MAEGYEEDGVLASVIGRVVQKQVLRCAQDDKCVCEGKMEVVGVNFNL